VPVPADSRLPPSAHAAAAPLVLNGSPASLAYPDVCAGCGAPARTLLTIEKVFERNNGDETPRGYVIGAAYVPFCPACTARHEREVKRVGRLWRLLLCFRSGVMISALGATLFAALMTQAALQRAVYGGARSAEVLGGLAACCALAAAGCARFAYNETRRFAVPAQTSVTRAFDFSDDRAGPSGAPRHVYRLANPTFAEAFRALNRDRHWDPASPGAVRTARNRWIAIALLAAAALAAALAAAAFQAPIRRLLGW
jgi:hypothetical protein